MKTIFKSSIEYDFDIDKRIKKYDCIVLCLVPLYKDQ